MELTIGQTAGVSEPPEPPRHPTCTFRPLTDDDLDLLHGWLNEPGVVAWWEGEDVSREAVARNYGSASRDRVEHWIIVVDGRDVGWIQCCAAADHEDEAEVREWWALGADRTAAGIDYLIGEPRDRGRGLGSVILRAFVTDVVFGRHPDWTQACASPYVANVGSWRALEKAGFTPLGDFDTAEGPCRLEALSRSEAAQRG